MENIIVAKYDNTISVGTLYVQKINRMSYRVLEEKSVNGAGIVKTIVQEDFDVKSYPTFDDAKAMAIRHAYAVCPGAKFDNLPGHVEVID